MATFIVVALIVLCICGHMLDKQIVLFEKPKPEAGMNLVKEFFLAETYYLDDVQDNIHNLISGRISDEELEKEALRSARIDLYRQGIRPSHIVAMKYFHQEMDGIDRPTQYVHIIDVNPNIEDDIERSLRIKKLDFDMTYEKCVHWGTRFTGNEREKSKEELERITQRCFDLTRQICECRANVQK